MFLSPYVSLLPSNDFSCTFQVGLYSGDIYKNMLYTLQHDRADTVHPDLLMLPVTLKHDFQKEYRALYHMDVCIQEQTLVL